jgi:hypothetical protein
MWKLRKEPIIISKLCRSCAKVRKCPFKIFNIQSCIDYVKTKNKVLVRADD